MGTVWSYLDAAPLGRQEVWEDSPAGYPQTPPYKWWNWHDNYEAEKSGRPAMVSDAGEAAFRNAEAGANHERGLSGQLGCPESRRQRRWGRPHGSRLAESCGRATFAMMPLMTATGG